MWGGRPWRGEQERVAQRVRELLGQEGPAVGEHAAAGPSPETALGPALAQHRSGPRWEPSRGAVISLGVLLVVVVVSTAWWYLSARAPAIPVSAGGVAVSPSFTPSGGASSAGSSAGSGDASAAPSGSATSIVVDVAGKVVHPGVYRLPAGARVDDAVRAAGGVRAGVNTVSLNLAAPLHDGDQVVVGEPGAAVAVGGDGGASAAPGLVDLNSATPDQLDALPGVGPVLAQHIVDWRVAHGGFTSIDQLQSVSGIGDAKFADLKPLVTI